MSQNPLNIVIVGHVDHGKSTLVGRLFYETGSLPEGKYEAIQATCQRRGVPFEWAFLMDAFQAERDQNITIDTAQIWFNTAKRPYVIIDAPGHKEFIKNMVTGAANANAALLLIAANEGVQEQSRRHGYLLSLLGIRQVAVVVNKMDMVDYDQATFEAIEAEYRQFLKNINIEPQVFIPISAREGDAIASKPTENMPWYQGPTIVEALDEFNQPSQPIDQPLRFPIQDIYRFDDRRILAGRIESGTLNVGDVLHFTPVNKSSVVKSIERWSAPNQDSAVAGESIGVTLEDQIFVERGHVGAHASTPSTPSNRLRANLFWLGNEPIKAGNNYKIKLGAQEMPVTIEEVVRVIDASTLDNHEESQKLVQKNDAAELVLRTPKPLALDLHQDFPITGRFVLVDGYDVAGGGIITEILDGTNIKEEAESQQPVSPIERYKRNRHRGVILVSQGLLPERSHPLMVQLERALFNRGMQTYLLQPAHSDLQDAEQDMRALALSARSLAAAGVVCLVNAPWLIGPKLRQFRQIADDAHTGFVVVHTGRFDFALAEEGERAEQRDDFYFGDADLIVLQQTTDIHERVTAIVEQLVPHLQRY